MASTASTAAPATATAATAAPAKAEHKHDAACGHDHGASAIAHRFKRGDFGWPITRPLHFDLHFDVTEARSQVVSRQSYVHTGDADLTSLQLNAHDLEIVSVSYYSAFEPLPVDEKKNYAIDDAKRDFVAHVASLKDTAIVAFPSAPVVDKPGRTVTVVFPTPIRKGQQFVIRTDSIARPDGKTLEGIYYDYTPAGQPRTMITQCQQYGFQRIVPCIDSMAAKPFYTTTIVADSRYTNIITNGDLAPQFFDEKGKVRSLPATPIPAGEPSAGQSRVQVTYYNHLVCMAPYLFFLGVGTYSTYRRRLEYPDGLETYLELLTFPNVEAKHARVALNSMHDSIIWTNVSTGPETGAHLAEEKKVYALIAQREAIKERSGGTITVGYSTAPIEHKFSAEDAKAIAAVRTELKSLMATWSFKQGYKYTGQVYREIAMENSNYGGMENVGNTTIISSRLVPSDDQPDRGYFYMEGVKVHEFYHNINGSQVTGISPFEIWLNEAVTVHIQRAREDDLFGHDYNRLSVLQYSFKPAVGTLAQDASPVSMAIEPEGFEDTHELITAMTYYKAPEFVRMIETLMGKARFARGLDLYHTRHSFSNASTADWIRAMEEESHPEPSKRLDFQTMAKGWLARTGFPEVSVETAYDAKANTYTIRLAQTGFEKKPAGNNQPWDMPIEYALMKIVEDEKKGRRAVELKHGVHRFNTATDTITITGVTEAPAYLSFARDWSFYGKYVHTNVTPAELLLQAQTDTDTVNRYFAYRFIVDKQKALVVKALAEGKGVDDSVKEGLRAIAGVQASILFDDTIKESTRALILAEGDGVNGYPELQHLYQEIFDAKVAIQQAVFDFAAERIIAGYRKLEDANRAESKDATHLENFHQRALKHHLLSLIADGQKPSVIAGREAPKGFTLDVTRESLALAGSKWMTDKIVGLARYFENETDATARAAALARTLDEWAVRPDKFESVILIIAYLDAPHAPEMIRALIADSRFKLELAGHSRTISRGWGGNRKRSLLTTAGLALTTELLLKIGKVNQFSASDILSAFNDLAKFTPEKRAPLLEALRTMRAGLDVTKEESLFKHVARLLLPYETAPAAATATATATATAAPAATATA